MNEHPDSLSILIIEDNPSDVFLIEEMLRAALPDVKAIYPADKIGTASQILEHHPVNLILLDLSLPDSFGLNTFEKVNKLAGNIPIIILTAESGSEVALEALNKGAQDYLTKGEFNQELLSRVIQYSIERKKAEERIYQSEEKYKQIFYQNPFPMWIYDVDTYKVLEVNHAAIEKYGYDRAAFLTLAVTDIQQPCGASAFSSLTDNAADKLYKHKKKNGTYMMVQLVCYPIRYNGKTAIQAQITDVTEKLRMQQQLSLQKRQLFQTILTAQENERKKLGEELHDNINQVLTAVSISLDYALEHPESRADLIAKSKKNTLTVIQEIRNLCKGLILPGNLKELGLVPSLELLIKDILEVTNIDIRLNAKGLEERTLSEEQKITLYRIVQEQLNNILKYAQASQVSIQLKTTGKRVSLSIADNGKGFNTTVKGKGLGVANIYSRAELLNGKVTIDSSPGNGCNLKIVFKGKTVSPQEVAIPIS